MRQAMIVQPLTTRTYDDIYAARTRIANELAVQQYSTLGTMLNPMEIRVPTSYQGDPSAYRELMALMRVLGILANFDSSDMIYFEEGYDRERVNRVFKDLAVTYGIPIFVEGDEDEHT